MARPSWQLVQALRDTAAALRTSDQYRWSSFSACNCGHLVQTVTGMEPARIREAAFSSPGDWGQQAREYCPGTGLELEHVFETLFSLGLDRDDFGHLERLSDRRVLRRIGLDVALHHNRRQDVARYVEAWADLLEEQLPVELPLAAE